jgi:hypothetical protein
LPTGPSALKLGDKLHDPPVNRLGPVYFGKAILIYGYLIQVHLTVQDVQVSLERNQREIREKLEKEHGIS